MQLLHFLTTKEQLGVLTGTGWKWPTWIWKILSKKLKSIKKEDKLINTDNSKDTFDSGLDEGNQYEFAISPQVFDAKFGKRYQLYPKPKLFEWSGRRLGRARVIKQVGNKDIFDKPIIYQLGKDKTVQTHRSVSKPKQREAPDNRRKKVHLFPYEISHKDHFPNIEFKPLRIRRKNPIFAQGEKIFEAAK